MPTIHCKAVVHTSDVIPNLSHGLLLTLPESASVQLPSRGMTMVKGTLNGHPFQAALEPDGMGSHWFKIKETLVDAAGVRGGDTVTLVMEPTREWPEPVVPADLQAALRADPPAFACWKDITPAARWDWIRWIGAAKQLETRNRRVENACSMLRAGKRRPCCFNRNQCTLTEA